MSVRQLLFGLLFLFGPLLGFAQFIPGKFDFESDATNLFFYSGRIWVSTANNGLFVSDDQGVTWLKKWRLNYLGSVNRLENNGVLQVNQVVVYQDVFYGCTDHGLYRSTDEGDNWQLVINFQMLNPGYGNLVDVPVKSIIFSPHKSHYGT